MQRIATAEGTESAFAGWRVGKEVRKGACARFKARDYVRRREDRDQDHLAPIPYNKDYGDVSDIIVPCVTGK